MRADDIPRAQRLFQVLAGPDGRESDFQRISAGCVSFDEFRIRLIADAQALPEAAPVAALWRTHVSRATDTPDTNELMHTLEQLSARQAALERTLHERDAELLDRLRQLDVLTTGLADMRKEVELLRNLICRYREAVLKLAETTP